MDGIAAVAAAADSRSHDEDDGNADEDENDDDDDENSFRDPWASPPPLGNPHAEFVSCVAVSSSSSSSPPPPQQQQQEMMNRVPPNLLPLPHSPLLSFLPWPCPASSPSSTAASSSSFDPSSVSCCWRDDWIRRSSS